MPQVEQDATRMTERDLRYVSERTQREVALALLTLQIVRMLSANRDICQ